MTIPHTTTVRLDPAAQAAVATIMAALATPLRSAPTISDAVRAGLIHTAATLPAAASETTKVLPTAIGLGLGAGIC